MKSVLPGLRRLALPEPRGPLSAHVVRALTGPLRRVERHPAVGDDPLAGDDFHLALYLCYELHYAALDGVEPGWEWEPTLLEFRRRLEDCFEKELVVSVPQMGAARPEGVPEVLIEAARNNADVALASSPNSKGPSLSRALEREPSLERFREFVVHRSAYHLKEADPHSWVIPRLTGRPKAALLEIQADEYGSGDPEAMHAALFARTMTALGLDARYGAYVSRLPGITLAGVNLMSMFGLHHRWRGAAVGHLAMFEMTSTEPNRRYGNALRRLGYGTEATAFYDEHVEADAVHENIAAYDLAGTLAREEPSLATDIELGARSLLHLEARWAEHVMTAWDAGRSSLL
ncbi:MAG: iron-containing redox enzyme family protein [Actinomycetota bacterium]|nr:iron-containing redox enzyme family protein [Actinomycetota bacterium]